MLYMMKDIWTRDNHIMGKLVETFCMTVRFLWWLYIALAIGFINTASIELSRHPFRFIVSLIVIVAILIGEKKIWARRHA